MKSPAEPWYQRGRQHQQKKEHAKALQAFAEAVKLDANHHRARVRLALEYDRANVYQTALEHYDYVKDRNPYDREAWLGVGFSHKRLGDTTKARQAWTHCCSSLKYRKCCDELSK